MTAAQRKRLQLLRDKVIVWLANKFLRLASKDYRERLSAVIAAGVTSALLRFKLAEQVKAELHSDEDAMLAGPLGEAIADAAGSCSLEFVTPEQLAEGIGAWLRGGTDAAR